MGQDIPIPSLRLYAGELTPRPGAAVSGRNIRKHLVPSNPVVALSNGMRSSKYTWLIEEQTHNIGQLAHARTQTCELNQTYAQARSQIKAPHQHVIKLTVIKLTHKRDHKSKLHSTSAAHARALECDLLRPSVAHARALECDLLRPKK